MDSSIIGQSNKSKLVYLALIVSSFFLIIPALYNHYPLVNPDTATYLASGFKPETPFDRPITYGLLIRLFSLNGLSLWFVVYVQAYIVSWLVFSIVRQIVAKPQVYILIGMGVILFLAMFTGLSWIVSQVQPDVFTPIASLCIILLLMDKEKRSVNFFIYFLFFLAIAIHLSHPLLFTAVLLCLLFLKRLFVEPKVFRSVNKKLTILIVLSICSIVIMGSAFAKSKHIYFTGSLLEKGVLKKYLDDNCVTHNYKICVYKDSLPAKSDDFIWDSSSPLYKIGDWKSTKGEFNDIIHNILTTPRYLKLYLYAGVKQSWSQACTFNIGDGNASFPPGSNVNNRVLEYFPGEINRFNGARQNSIDHFERLFILPDTIFVFIFWLSCISLFPVLIRWRRTTNEFRLVFTIALLSIILNILDCAALGTVNGRYGCKMMWLFPFCITLYFLSKKSVPNE